jgi:hypothetical protein
MLRKAKNGRGEKKPRRVIYTRLASGGPVPDKILPPLGPAGDVPMKRQADDKQPAQ